MTAPAWLMVAAAVLALVAGWCANAEAALALVSATGVRTAGTHRPLSPFRRPAPLHERPAPAPGISEVLAAVLSRRRSPWLGDDWRAVLAALAVVIGLRYMLTGVAADRASRPATERTAERAAEFLFPLTRALGPLPRMLVAVGRAMPPTRRVRAAAEDRRGPR